MSQTILEKISLFAKKTLNSSGTIKKVVFLTLLVIISFGFASQKVFATSWTQNFTDSFNRADGAVGNNWIDVAGGKWTIAGDTLQGTTSDANGYLTDLLKRPSTEESQDQRVVVVIPANGNPVTGNAGVDLRVQSNGNYYLFSINSDTGSKNGTYIHI
jgi:hypothetical protein